MFEYTGYEAFYSYIGLYLHQESLVIIKGSLFKSILLFIFAIGLFLSIWAAISKHTPWFIPLRNRSGARGFFKSIIFFVMALSLLSIENRKEIYKPNNKELWNKNSYVIQKARATGINPSSYNVSSIFSIMTTAAEEVALYINKRIDHLFTKSNGEIQPPGAFYKAVLYAGTRSIENKDLTRSVDLYNDKCIEAVIPFISNSIKERETSDLFSYFFKKDDSEINKELEDTLSEIHVQSSEKNYTCLHLKNQISSKIAKEATKVSGFKNLDIINNTKYAALNMAKDNSFIKNFAASSILLNYYKQKHNDVLGVNKSARTGSSFANFLISWDKAFSYDGLMNLVGMEEHVGAQLVAKRASQFSDNLQRAPHVKGVIKMILIAFFPWLVFLVAAGRWKVILGWYVVYFSVLLWTPIWTLLYYIMTSVAMSTKMVSEMGTISSDSISMYSANFIYARMHQFYAMYAWLQILVGPLPTLFLAKGLIFSSLIKDFEQESVPAPLDLAKNISLDVVTGGSHNMVNNLKTTTVNRN